MCLPCLPPPHKRGGGEGGVLIEMGAKKGEHIGFRGEHSYLKSMVHESSFGSVLTESLLSHGGGKCPWVGGGG